MSISPQTSFDDCKDSGCILLDDQRLLECNETFDDSFDARSAYTVSPFAHEMGLFLDLMFQLPSHPHQHLLLRCLFQSNVQHLLQQRSIVSCIHPYAQLPLTPYNVLLDLLFTCWERSPPSDELKYSLTGLMLDIALQVESRHLNTLRRYVEQPQQPLVERE